jgi:hypothetical protein
VPVGAGGAQALPHLQNQRKRGNRGLHVEQQAHGLCALHITASTTHQVKSNTATGPQRGGGGYLSSGCAVIDARTAEHMVTCSAATASADCKPQQDTSSHSCMACAS